MRQLEKQLTLRSVIAGMCLGGFMSLSNLYVGLKTGWGLGVSITAGILAYAIFAVLFRLKLVKTHFGMLENNAMQSVASAAGYMTGGGTIAAIPALMMITGQTMGMMQMFFWISSIAFLGVIMAIPMKQQLINIEQLRFPSGVAAAETLKALHATGEEGANSGSEKAKLLTWSGAIGAIVAFFRDAKASWMPFNLPEKIAIFPSLTIAGRPLMDFTISMEGSVIMLGAGAIMGFRAAWSMLLGAVVNYLFVAPWLFEHGIIGPKLGYKNIVGWSVWFGSALLLTSGLLSFALQWKTVLRAMKSVGNAFNKEGGAVDPEMAKEVPMSWFFWGMVVVAPMVVFLEWHYFGIKIWMGLLSVVLSFFIALVACRATGETDTTPTGALGKITQITFGVLDPGNVTTNLMTANATGGVALHSADLLTDLKSGYLLKADPRQQFWAQFFGVVAGSFFVVPAYHLLIPDASVLGSDQWPAPAAQTWKGVAELLAKGIETLHPTARLAILVGALVGVGIVLLEHYFPKAKKWIPSAAAFGLGFTSPGYNTIAMFIGAVLTLFLEKNRPELAERGVIPVSSGFIAGESLMGVVIAALVVAGLMS
ncbi:MAG: hypothetical protein RJB66_692 [Pseudomonadota bacterium]